VQYSGVDGECFLIVEAEDQHPFLGLIEATRPLWCIPLNKKDEMETGICCGQQMTNDKEERDKTKS